MASASAISSLSSRCPTSPNREDIVLLAFFPCTYAHVFRRQLPSRRSLLELTFFVLDFFSSREALSPLCYPSIDSFRGIQQERRPLNRDRFSEFQLVKPPGCVNSVYHGPLQAQVSIPIILASILPPRRKYKVTIHHMDLDGLAGAGERTALARASTVPRLVPAPIGKGIRDLSHGLWLCRRAILRRGEGCAQSRAGRPITWDVGR